MHPELDIYLLSAEIDEASQSLEDLQEDLHSKQERWELCKQDPEAWQARLEAFLQKRADVTCYDCGPPSDWECKEGYIRKGNRCVKE